MTRTLIPDTQKPDGTDYRAVKAWLNRYREAEKRYYLLSDRLAEAQEATRHITQNLSADFVFGFMFFLRSHSFPNAQSGKLSFRIPQLPVAKPSLVEQFPAVINKFLSHQVVERDDVSAGLVPHLLTP
jgi:hypothetical protein